MDSPDQRSEGSPNQGEPSPSYSANQDEPSPSLLPEQGETRSPGPPVETGVSPSPGPAGSQEWYSQNGSTIAPAPKRRDHLSVWSIVVILIYFALQGLSMTNWSPIPSRHHAIPKSTPAARTALASEDGFEKLVMIDLYAKVAYFYEHFNSVFAALGPPPTAEPSPAPAKPAKGTKTAPAAPATKTPVAGKAPVPRRALGRELPSFPKVVGQAEAALRADPTNIDFARRVILLRAEAGLVPLAPIPASKTHKGIATPLDAFQPTPGLPARDSAQLTAESALWKEIFSAPKLSPNASVPDLARRVRAVPALNWYRPIALRQLYLRAGDTAQAAREQSRALDQTLYSLVMLAILGAAIYVMLGVGALFLAALGVGAMIVSRRGMAGAAGLSPFTVWLVGLGQPKAPAVPDDRRQLGAGDLMDGFMIYLAANLILSYVFQRLAEGPWHSWLASLSFQRTIDFTIQAEFVLYVFTALLPLLWLGSVARRRGTSLFAELGLTTDRLGKNILFGLAGWGIALALVLALGSLTNNVFKNAPEPTNPVVELVTGSSDTGSRILLYILAAFAAPFFEETLFRGVFFNAARLRVGPWPAIVLTGLVFGFAHPVGVGQAIILSTLGAVFAWMAYTRKSLVPSMTGHFLQNTYATLMMWLIFLVAMPR